MSEKTISITYATEATITKNDKDEVVSARPAKRATVEVEFDHEATFDALPVDLQRKYGLKEFKTTAQDMGRRLASCDPIGEGITDPSVIAQKLNERDWSTSQGGGRLTGIRADARDISKALKASESSLDADTKAKIEAKLAELRALTGA